MAPNRGGRGNVKRASANTKSPPGSRSQENNAHGGSNNPSPPEELLSTYQRILDCFLSTFPQYLSQSAIENTLSPLIQEVKAYLYHRDFEKTFCRREYLEVYALRWSVSRAMGYLSIFDDVLQRSQSSNNREEKTGENVGSKAVSDSPTRAELPSPVRRITCLGGGAAELCALGGLLHSRGLILPNAETVLPKTPAESEIRISVRLIDMADWSPVTTALHTTLTSPPPLSAYASAAARAVNDPLVSLEKFDSEFQRIDVLDSDRTNSGAMYSCIAESDIITIMFTLNELYNLSLPKTQRLLIDITTTVRPGTLLLVVDSPGSYSTVSINEREKKYPMSWLLDHTLLVLAARACDSGNAEEHSAPRQPSSADASTDLQSKGGQQPSAVWEKLISKESEWFRLPVGLRYPLELENMRYQIHLYRRM